MPASRRLDQRELLPDRVPAAEPDVKTRQDVVLVAIDQRDAMLDRSLERAAEIVGVDDRRQMAEALRQGDGLVPRQELALLDVEPRVGKLGDRSHVVEMGVGDDDVGHRLGGNPHLREHPHRRDPGRDLELAGKTLLVLILHEAGIDEHDAVAPACEDERERQVHHAVGVHAADQVDPRLVLAPRVLDDEDIPVVVLGHGASLTFSQRPAEAR